VRYSETSLHKDLMPFSTVAKFGENKTLKPDAATDPLQQHLVYGNNPIGGKHVYKENFSRYCFGHPENG
jgi:hypothetical protein